MKTNTKKSIHFSFYFFLWPVFFLFLSISILIAKYANYVENYTVGYSETCFETRRSDRLGDTIFCRTWAQRNTLKEIVYIYMCVCMCVWKENEEECLLSGKYVDKVLWEANNRYNSRWNNSDGEKLKIPFGIK